MSPKHHLELDALQFEAEEEEASYLTDMNKIPDFVDEAPVELGQVRSYFKHDTLMPTLPTANIIGCPRSSESLQLDSHTQLHRKILYKFVCITSNGTFNRSVYPLRRRRTSHQRRE